jgi:hypothetical protein
VALPAAREEMILEMKVRRYQMTVAGRGYDENGKRQLKPELHFIVARSGSIRTVRRQLTRRGRDYFQQKMYRELGIWIPREHIRKGFPAKRIDIITGRPTRVEIPARIARRVQDLAIAETPFSTGFRGHKQLRSLVEVHALYRGRSKVTMEDFEEIRRLSKFMNLDFSKI